LISDEGAQTLQWGKGQSFQQMVLGQCDMLKRDSIQKIKRQSQTGRKHLQIIHFIIISLKSLNPEYVENSSHSLLIRNPNFKIGKNLISPKKIDE
jgi:hypothetical protein